MALWMMQPSQHTAKALKFTEGVTFMENTRLMAHDNNSAASLYLA